MTMDRVRRLTDLKDGALLILTGLAASAFFALTAVGSLSVFGDWHAFVIVLAAMIGWTNLIGALWSLREPSTEQSAFSPARRREYRHRHCCCLSLTAPPRALFLAKLRWGQLPSPSRFKQNANGSTVRSMSPWWGCSGTVFGGLCLDSAALSLERHRGSSSRWGAPSPTEHAAQSSTRHRGASVEPGRSDSATESAALSHERHRGASVALGRSADASVAKSGSFRLVACRWVGSSTRSPTGRPSSYATDAGVLCRQFI